MHPLIEKYGKPLMRELLDMVMIDEDISDARARHFLIKHNIVTQHTKTVTVFINPRAFRYDRVKDEADFCKLIKMKNGRGELKFNAHLFDSHMNQLMEELK